MAGLLALLRTSQCIRLTAKRERQEFRVRVFERRFVVAAQVKWDRSSKEDVSFWTASGSLEGAIAHIDRGFGVANRRLLGWMFSQNPREGASFFRRQGREGTRADVETDLCWSTTGVLGRK